MSSDKDGYSRDVDRRMMERSFFNNYDTSPSSSDARSDKLGEITGEVFDTSYIDQGMPMRGGIHG